LLLALLTAEEHLREVLVGEHHVAERQQVSQVGRAVLLHVDGHGHAAPVGLSRQSHRRRRVPRVQVQQVHSLQHVCPSLGLCSVLLWL
jgi:hypothetical protein